MDDLSACSDVELDDEESCKLSDASIGPSMPPRKRAHNRRDRILRCLARDALEAIQHKFPGKTPDISQNLLTACPMSPRSFFRAAGFEHDRKTSGSASDFNNISPCSFAKEANSSVSRVLKSANIPVLIHRKRKECVAPRKEVETTSMEFKVPEMSQIEEGEDNWVNDENCSPDQNPESQPCATPEYALLHKKKRLRLDDSSCVTPSTAQAARTLLALMR